MRLKFFTQPHRWSRSKNVATIRFNMPEFEYIVQEDPTKPDENLRKAIMAAYKVFDKIYNKKA